MTFLDGRVTLHAGDCLDVLKTLPDASVDSCVTDPPYFLTSIVKRFGADNSAPCQTGSDGRFKRLSGGFMQKRWDAPDAPAIDPCFANWMAGFIDGEGCFSVHKKTVNGCETYDCQFSINLRADDKSILVEMQRQLGGIGSLADRPKRDKGEAQARYCISSKADCQRLRAVLLAFPLRAKKARDFEIWCHALDAWVNHEPRSSWEDVAYYRDALMAVRQYGAAFHPNQIYFYRWAREVHRVLKPGAHLLAFGGPRTYHRLAAAIEDAGFEIRDCVQWIFGSGFPKSHNAGDGWGTALKPACEPIVLARKSLIGTVASNVLAHGTGALNIDGCRVAAEEGANFARPVNHTGLHEGWDRPWKHDPDALARERLKRDEIERKAASLGRWPANVIHDGSDEVVGAFPESDGAQGRVTGKEPSTDSRYILNGLSGNHDAREPRGDSGSAARFFYTAKADSDDRIGSKHPTIKPVDLIQYLVRLITPKGGTVLDCFAGTGTTGEAAYREGMKAILIEREAEYVKDIERRMALVLAGPEERARESLKARGLANDDAGPLFSGVVA